MELRDYARLLRKWWWIILISVTLTAGAAVAFSELEPPRYTSTAEVIIEPARPDWGLGQATKMLLRTYMSVIDSNEYAQRVIDELQLGLLAEELRAKAHFAAQDDRMAITIEIEDSDETQANRIAKAWAEQLIHWRDQQNQLQRKEDRVYASLRDEPTAVPSWPPGTRIMLVAGTIFGLGIAGAVILFLEWLEAGVIRTPQDLEQQAGLPVMGVIPSA